ncbi:phytoene desaturase family protein [Spirochaeta cellobiosiphila]|uniref:phytoene desaturase family protein n=1 Tax=Spirochaeta cellobiosiphila TaxID=504483 RepID=UPI0003F7DC31|nr:phytoene desaturase family protein [Spirochaeta cellobiosiphila]
MDIIVIGAGFAGLSCAARLAAEGNKVTILEKNESLGGRAREWKTEGFTFDMGPSWYLMPEVFDELFKDLNLNREDYYELVELDTYYKVFFENHPPLTISSDFENTLEVFRSLEDQGDKKLKDYLDKAAYKYNVAMSEFLYKDYKHIGQFFNRKMMTEGLKLDIFSPLDKFVSKYFKDIRAKQILEYAMVFLGNSPKNAPALYSLMSHVDLNLGVYFPKGGMHAVAKGLARVCMEKGVSIHVNQEVTSYKMEGKRIRSVVTRNKEYPADLVIMTGDYHHGETELLPPSHQTYPSKYWKKKTMAPSMLLAYIGTNKKFPELEHHNLYFSEDWDAHFDTIFKTKTWPDNPCFYLSVISKTDPEMAPSEGDNLFLLFPVAPGMDDSQREAYFDKALAHVEQRTGQTIKDSIIVKRLYSHRDFTEDYNAYKGTALGLAHTLFQTAVFRPGHKSKKVRNLWYNGQYTHPGVGVPMTLISSKILAQEIKNESKRLT